MLEAIQSLDEEPEQVQVSVETMRTAAPAVAATVAVAAILAAYNCSTVGTVHHVKWTRASSTEPPLNCSDILVLGGV